MRIELIEALIEQHKQMNCPGIVLPVAHVEELVQAYKLAQQVREMGIRAWIDNDRKGLRNLLNQLPEDK